MLSSATRRRASLPRMASRSIVLARVAAITLLVGAVVALGVLLVLGRTAEAPVGRALARLNAADDVVLALDAGATAARPADLAARLERLQALSASAPDQAARSREIARLTMAASSGGGDPSALDQARRLIVSYRQHERTRVTTWWAGLVDRQQAFLFIALAAVVLGFLAGGVVAFGLLARSRAAETSFAELAEEAGRRTAFLEAFGAQTSDLIHARDLDYRFVYANPATLRAMGFSWEEVVGRRMEDLVGPGALNAAVVAADVRVIETGQPETVETAHIAPDGVERHIRTTRLPLRNADGAIIGLAGLTFDQTQEHQARLALAASEERFRTIANAMPAIVWSSTGAGVYDFFNERWYEFTGASRDGRSVRAWKAVTHADDTDRVLAASRRSMETGEHFEIEYRLRRHDGEYRWVLARALAIKGDDGTVVRWMGTVTDIQDMVENRHARESAISDLQAREAHLQSILDSVPDAMVAVDDRGIIQSFSKTAEQQFGWAAVEVVGRDVDLLFPESELHGHDSHLTRYLVTGETPAMGKRRDGATFPIEVAVGEMTSGDRRLFTGFFRDLTERQAAQQRLQKLQSEFAHASRLSAMGEMASALAHELNQPLSATANYVQGSLRLLTQPAIDVPQIGEALGEAGEQLFRAGDIIRRLREFVTRGETERRIENLSRLLKDAGALAMVGAKDRGVRLRYEIAPAVDLVLVDKVQIQQVVLNLMRNAVEAMADSPKRELVVAATKAANDMVLVSVKDTGSGVSEEVASQLFQPFVTSKHEGMGVGLSISRTIVEAHGGRIWAEPNPDGGTIFRFTLRAVLASELEDGGLV